MKYLLYILKHKYYFFLEAIKMGLFWPAITPDWSKFLPSEFIDYNNYLYGPKRHWLRKGFICNDFMLAWCRHQQRNPHHWEAWAIGGAIYPMPEKYVKEMICDWKAMEMDGKQPAIKYYEKNKKSMFLHEKTKDLIEKLLYK